MGDFLLTGIRLSMTLVLVWGGFAVAKPLTEADVREAKKIGIMFGSFDPVNSGHIGTAEAAAAEAGLDFTVILPIDNPLKNPLSVPVRLEMIDLAAWQSQQVFYPKSGELYQHFLDEGLGKWVSRLRAINPNVEIHAVIGSDVSTSLIRTLFIDKKLRPDGWVISPRPGTDQAEINRIVSKRPHRTLQSASARTVSSTKVKEFLSEHPEFYADAAQYASHVPGVHPSVAEYILEHEHYLSSSRKLGFSAMRCFRNAMQLMFHPHHVSAH